MAKAQTQIVVFLGTDEGRVQQEALAAVRRLTPPDAGDFGVETINGTAENADDARRICQETVQALATLPFFGGGKVVWLKNANFLVDNQTGRAQAALEGIDSLQALLEKGLGPEVFFVMNAAVIDKRRSFYKLLKSVATIAEHDLPDMGKNGGVQVAEARARDLAAARDLRFDPGALNLLVRLAGADSRQLEAEIEKIDLFAGSGYGGKLRVTEQVVSDLVAHTRSAVIFAVGDAVGKRQLGAALEQIDLLLAQGESPIAILLATIVPKLRNLLTARALRDECRVHARSYQDFQRALERLPDNQTRHIARTKTGGFNAYPLWLAFDESEKFKLAELREAMSAALAANRSMVTSQLEGRVVLAKLLAGVLTRSNNSKGREAGA